MTVIDGIDIDEIQYTVNDIKLAIKNNDPIEDMFHVILVISNPCMYGKRYKLMNEFVHRIEEEEDRVLLYVVELAYGDQSFFVTQSDNSRHLQIRTRTPLWHKENMINLAVQRLLPSNYKAFAWIDADIEFDSLSWATDALKLLNGSKDVIQLFSHCVDMDADKTTLRIFHGFGYSYSKQKEISHGGIDFWHPGFAWAMTRKAYEKMGGLYDKAILGSGDSIMALAFVRRVKSMHNKLYTKAYNDSMTEVEQNVSHLRLGYVPGVIRHYYHGSKQNRQYAERWKILMKHAYSPDQVDYENGILVPHFSEEFKEDIMQYFRDRKEDE